MEKTHLGIVLAGAVTAGAFTAGVMDYLINALKNWEDAYEQDPMNVPKPNVVLDVLTGASAGSIAAAVTTLGLATNQLPFVSDVHSASAGDNMLFDTWVNLGLSPNETILDNILSLDDIHRDENNKKVLRSLLNTSFIENLMEKLILQTNQSAKENLPSFVNPDLEILFTLSNLRGLPIDLYFSSSQNSVGHTMSYHKAYALFQFGQKTYDPENLAEILPFDISNPAHIANFLNCARASGAFPIGLKSIPFENVPHEYINANIKRLFGTDINIVPRVNEDYSFIAVDGGMTNNEPLAEAMKSLEKFGNKYKMILIDPFPSDTLDDTTTYDVKKDSVFDTLPQLYKTLRDQAIFKESDIVDLFREDANKHMIWPTRYDKNHKALDNAIACGALSGFSGFLNRDFRLHDYQLGQKNAQNFLRFYFHKELKEEDTYSTSFIQKFKVTDKAGKVQVPIIPDYTIARREDSRNRINFYPTLEDKLIEFPVMNFAPVIDGIKPKLNKRLKEIIDISFTKFTKPPKIDRYPHPLVAAQNRQTIWQRITNWFFQGIGNMLMSGIGKRLLRKSIAKKIITTMIVEMDEYKLIK